MKSVHSSEINKSNEVNRIQRDSSKSIFTHRKVYTSHISNMKLHCNSGAHSPLAFYIYAENTLKLLIDFWICRSVHSLSIGIKEMKLFFAKRCVDVPMIVYPRD